MLNLKDLTQSFNTVMGFIPPEDKALATKHISKAHKGLRKSFKQATPLGKALYVIAGIAAIGTATMAVHKTTNYLNRNSSKQKELGVLDARRA